MQGTYDRTFALGHSSSDNFQSALNRIIRLKKHRVKINRLNSKYLYRINDFNKKSSLAVRLTLCPKCSEDQELCEADRDEKRRYYCKALSKAMGEHVRLYLSSKNDIEVRKEHLKKALQQAVVRNYGASQTKLISIVRGDFKLCRECLDELTARGIIKCRVTTERNKPVKRYYPVYD